MEPDGCYRCVFRRLNSVFCHIYSAEVAVPHGLDFIEGFDEVFFIRAVLIRYLDMTMPVVCLRVKLVLADYCVE